MSFHAITDYKATLTHSVLKVSVLGREPDLSLSSLIRSNSETIRAARSPNLEASLFIHLNESETAEFGDNRD